MDKNYQKRIEKIAQAIYLVTNHLKDSEPLKWELRKEGIGFLSCLRSMSEEEGMNDIPPDLIVDTLSTYARDLTSLLTLGAVSGLISRNNSSIVIQEIQSFLVQLQENSTTGVARTGLVLSQDFFASDPDFQEHLNLSFDKGQVGAISDKITKAAKDSFPLLKSDKNTQSFRAQYTHEIKRENADSLKDKKDSRQMKILTLLRARSNLSIKDFASVIPDCSEKTIQRELLELVEKGIVKKEGERRWSTYSLK